MHAETSLFCFSPGPIVGLRISCVHSLQILVEGKVKYPTLVTLLLALCEERASSRAADAETLTHREFPTFSHNPLCSHTLYTIYIVLWHSAKVGAECISIYIYVQNDIK